MTIASVIRDALLDMSAVTALTSTIRVFRLDERDRPDQAACLLIDVPEIDTDTNGDLGGTVDIALAKVAVTALGPTLETCWALTEAVRRNGTSPGTGLQGMTNNSPYFVSLLMKREAGEYVLDDGSDIGVSYVESTYDVLYRETQ